MGDIVQQIKEKYAEWYPDLTNPVSNEDISMLISHDCECDSCGDSIFDMEDFPNVSQKHDFVLCEECYNEKYMETCSICEENYDISDGNTDIIVINEELGKTLSYTPGIYKILEYPFFYGDMIFGFEGFYPNAIELVTPIRINEYKKINVGKGFEEVSSGHICPDCINRFTKTSGWATLETPYCILLEKYRYNTFADYSDEEIHQHRQEIVHRRITLKGIIEKATDKNFKRKEKVSHERKNN